MQQCICTVVHAWISPDNLELHHWARLIFWAASKLLFCAGCFATFQRADHSDWNWFSDYCDSKYTIYYQKYSMENSRLEPKTMEVWFRWFSFPIRWLLHIPAVHFQGCTVSIVSIVVTKVKSLQLREAPTRNLVVQMGSFGGCRSNRFGRKKHSESWTPWSKCFE